MLKEMSVPTPRWFGSLTIVFQRPSIKSEVASTSFRFPETKSAHLKFSSLSVSDCNL